MYDGYLLVPVQELILLNMMYKTATHISKMQENVIFCCLFQLHSSHVQLRTLSENNRGFNPYHYQIGSVWPHDNGFIAQGMKRYGFHDEALKIAKALTESASFFARDQMPELYAGTTRGPTSFPVQYLGANVPQGWAAGSMFSLLQAIVGFRPVAPQAMLYVDPLLPDWMPELCLRDLTLGQQTFDIRFKRQNNETEFEVLRGAKDRVQRRPMTQWALQLRGG